MFHSYNEIYLSNARRKLGHMIDFAVNDCKFIADEFFDMFIQSGIAEQFGKGNPKYIAGKSGAELVYDTIFSTKNIRIQTEPSFHIAKTPEYWAGWSLAHYQWISGKSFKSIHKVINFEDMLKWYPTLHEADISKFVEIANERFSSSRFKDSEELSHYCALFSKITELLPTKETVNIAIEGNCGSGKSTLADIIASRYECNVFRMDDFFLRSEQKTAERLTETGGNIDYERFVAEIADKIRPLNTVVEPFSYRKYDCKTLTLGNPINVVPKRLNIIEGCYSMHPAIPDIYDLKIFLKIDSDTQSQRILARNGEFMHKKFLNEWIPMENEYFKAFDIERKCDLVYIS